VPTPWGAPTFEIDGIKMLPTARVSPYADAEYKVSLVRPRGKRILDTCAGLGYFAAWCLRGGAAQLHSYEKTATCSGSAASIPGRPTARGPGRAPAP
jgi:predicted methyltransferase